jgi:pyruvate dehydrogenase E2 component (dihydrolipoamide acetyltransferase)
MTEISMPKLSDSMEEGTILKWLKAAGDTVSAGEDLVEIETDKATMTYESPGGGFLSIVAAEGDTVPVGTPIATLGDETGAGERDSAPAVTEPEHDAQLTIAESPSVPVEVGSALAPAASNGEGVSATPLARRIARIHGIDLVTLKGSGPNGRIIRTDVAKKAGIAVAPLAPASAHASDRVPDVASALAPATVPPAPRDSAKGEVTIEEPTRIQEVIARRMSQAKASAPDFQVQTEVRMDDAIALRGQLKQLGGDGVPSINDVIVKAAALALRDWPRANGSYVDGRFELYSRVNVGIAVATNDALVVPTIADADKRSLGSIAAESRRLADRVRSGEITPSELSGATFTVSNLGMYGMTAITSVINTPQAGILGVGASRPVPALEDGRLIERQMMTLTLTCDHRILYGADAAQFLSAIRFLLEQPTRLLL